jgi:transposase InsO family protein
VRDLGSGEMVMTLPVMDMTGRTVRDALASLFLRYGCPLVIKSDNGSGFIDEETRTFLNEHRVLLLDSLDHNDLLASESILSEAKELVTPGGPVL